MAERESEVEPSAEQLAALQRFANQHGRRWKSELSTAWSTGRDDTLPDGPLLRQVRNGLGPQWLFSMKNPIKPGVALDAQVDTIMQASATRRSMKDGADDVGKALAESIRTSLEGKQHRFELQDLFADTTFRFQTAEAATAKADQLGTTRFQNRDAAGSVKQVNKVGGQWVRDDGQILADVQDDIDRDSVRTIEARAEQRAAVGLGLDAEVDKQMALADAHAFRRIQDPTWQEKVAVKMADIARKYPEYRDGLYKAIPGYPGTAEKVFALDAAAAEKAAALDAESAEKVQSGAETERDGQHQDEENAILKVSPVTHQAAHDEVDAITPAARRSSAAGRKEVAEVSPEGPRALLNGRFSRDENGEYRRLGEKRVALADEGERIRFVDKQLDAFEAGVELAKTKGWEAIQVAGTEKFRSEAWFHARMEGLEVIGYEPTARDTERLEAAQARTGKTVATPTASEIESKRQAEDHVLGRGSAVHQANVEQGRYAGKVVHETQHHFVQEIGRGMAVIHEKGRFGAQDLTTAMRGAGASRIQYQDGKGAFDAVREQHRAHGR